MTCLLSAFLAAMGQESYSLAPEDAGSPARLMVTVPEPQENAGVLLQLMLPDGSSRANESPRLLSGRGWMLAARENRYILLRNGENDPDIPGISWAWRDNGLTRMDNWPNLLKPPALDMTGKAGLATSGWMAMLAECAGAMVIAAVLYWRFFRTSPACRMQRLARSAGTREAAWTAIHSFLTGYLHDRWGLGRHRPSLDWHTRRLDPSLGRRLEQLLAATSAARHGTLVPQPEPILIEWVAWLNDAEAYRARRL